MPLRFVFGLHDHQPVGNFDSVFEQAYRDGYEPMLGLLEQFPEIKTSLHVSGSLLDWLVANRPPFLARLRQLAASGQLEILGGGFYEPILSQLPRWDRQGQLTTFTRRLQDLFGVQIRGAWLAERVWEPELASDLVDAGIGYTLLDDYHFKQAGLEAESLFGHFRTEDQGRVMSVFPISEPLRYLVPWKSPEEAFAYLRELHSRRPNAVVVCADDGEKFGVWPETNKHVFQNGWLRRFFELIRANSDVVQPCTLAEAHDQTPSQGLIYLPDCSYREMTEWAMSGSRYEAHQQVVKHLESDPFGAEVKQFLRGGFFRNFRAKYPEAQEMYSRMMQVSKLLHSMAGEPAGLQRARRELYMGQCNCAYWHGAFGGLYLPHLRNAVYQHLIKAENLARNAQAETLPVVEAVQSDWNLDGEPEIRITNMHVATFVAPSLGGCIYELDVRPIEHNLLATLDRRPEPYHATVLRAATGGEAANQVSLVADAPRFKQAGLEKALRYDRHRRKSLIDHFYPLGTSLENLVRLEEQELGDFVQSGYEVRAKQTTRAVQVILQRQGRVGGLPVRVTKVIGLDDESNTLQLRYLLEGLPNNREVIFAVEFNFAGMAAAEEDRYYFHDRQARAGQLQTLQDVQEVKEFGLVDEWLGLEMRLGLGQVGDVWAFPIQTVSQSEGGYELVHQSCAVLPHWTVRGDAQGKWETTMQLKLDSTRGLNKRLGN